MAYFGLTDAAKEIGICRAWLYRKYLKRYPPKIVGGSPKLTDGQIERIKNDVDAARKPRPKVNGKEKK